jgi:pyrroloquinoline-quinone synthase
MTTLAPSELATAPRPPVPVLEHPLGPDELEAALRSFHGSYYVQHPFHQLMYEGKLSRRQFQGWVANRLAYQRVVPRKDAAILSNCPDPEVRREWIGRIIDHDGTAPGTGGIELWIRLGIALGVPREEMEDERHVLPAVRLICESYVTFCRTHPWQEACASSLTELFAPKIHEERIPGMLQGYPFVTDEMMAYFRNRLGQAPRDAGFALDYVRRHADTPEKRKAVCDALLFKINVLWAQLDALHHAYVLGGGVPPGAFVPDDLEDARAAA